MKLFALDATKEFAERVAAHLGTPLGQLEELEFADGERKVRATESLRGQDVYAIQSLYADPRQSIDDKLVRLLFLIGALHECGAQRVTAVIPYLAYGRQDRQAAAHDPVTTRYLAELLESAGADAVVTLDVHNLAALPECFPQTRMASRFTSIVRGTSGYFPW